MMTGPGLMVNVFPNWSVVVISPAAAMMIANGTRKMSPMTSVQSATTFDVRTTPKRLMRTMREPPQRPAGPGDRFFRRRQPLPDCTGRSVEGAEHLDLA